MALITDASGGSTHSSIGEQKVTLVFFLGGVTFAEVSALRFLAHVEDGNDRFLYQFCRNICNCSTAINDIFTVYSVCFY